MKKYNEFRNLDIPSCSLFQERLQDSKNLLTKEAQDF